MRSAIIPAIVVSLPMAVNAAHWACTQEVNGVSDPAIAQAFVESTPTMDLKTAAIFVDTAREMFCP
jgi:hypothetical protein